MAIIIAGERSGVGKTTITLAILSWLKCQGKSIQSFKVGPDYIDPMFHTAITGNPCRNLDPILTSDDYVRWCFNYHSQQAEMSVIEGVMGLFDGVPNGISPYYGSTGYIAKLLDIPVILIIDCSRLSLSVGAIALGYINFDPQVKIVGIILNKVGSEKHLSLLKEGLKQLSIPVVGVWFRDDKIQLPSRHLGLIPTEEIHHREDIFQTLGKWAEKNIHWQLLTPYLVKEKSDKQDFHYFIQPRKQYKLNIGIARDKSFNFYYQDNLDILEHFGAKLINISPLKDKGLPHNLDGIYLGGGFPEVFAQQLSKNQTFKNQLKELITQGIPVYAECGGMMYLSQAIEDFNGNSWEMVGALPYNVKMAKKLTIGYRKANILVSNGFINENQMLVGHEFHHSIDSEVSSQPMLEIKDYYSKKIVSYQGWQINNIFSSYLHIHFANFIDILELFLTQCLTL